MLAGITDALLDRLGPMIGLVALLEDHARAVDSECHVRLPDFSLAWKRVVGSLAATTDRLEDMPEFIYQMRSVRKAHGDKVILDEVTLAFLPGAKIGVVGPNGTGKSTLLRLMAGLEQPSNGDARLMPGFTVGLLDQEPQLDESKTVLANVEEGVAETKALLDRYNEIAEQMATDYSDELLEEMGKLQEQLDHRNAWDLESQLEQPMDGLPCPPP